MYRSRARYYDPIYSWKDYAAESQRLREMLASFGVSDGSRILEAACGTGSHLVHLHQWYQSQGFDLSAEMIAIARRKLPESIHLWQADMTNFKVDEPADALLCLFSSIGYVFPEAHLRTAASCFARAVRPGGAIIVEPWIAPVDYTPGQRGVRTYDGDDYKLCRITTANRRVKCDGADLAVMDFHWIALAADESETDCFTERHEMWMCPRDLLVNVFCDAGFDASFTPDGLMPKRGLLVGTRR
jgi:SAM-dependent methyltransferase